LAVALTGRLLFFGLAGTSQQPVHHWRLTSSNRHANLAITYFQRLTSVLMSFVSAIWKDQAGILLKTIEAHSKTTVVLREDAAREQRPGPKGLLHFVAFSGA